MSTQAKVIQKTAELLISASVQPKKADPALNALIVSEQPFDPLLLSLSPLYRLNRNLFLKHGGTFHPQLLSSQRTLSSDILLDNVIPYSPLASELLYNPSRAYELRSWITTLFHETSHRLLWHWLPPAPIEKGAHRRFLNLVESLVITLDMALGDELGEHASSAFYLLGCTYDPGTSIRQEIFEQEHLSQERKSRLYLNVLHAACFATYLHLEGYNRKQVLKATQHLYARPIQLIAPYSDLLDRAVARALRIDKGFVQKTNPIWQAKNLKHTQKKLKKIRYPKTQGLALGLSQTPLTLPSDPLHHEHLRLFYLVTEAWLKKFNTHQPYLR